MCYYPYFLYIYMVLYLEEPHNQLIHHCWPSGSTSHVTCWFGHPSLVVFRHPSEKWWTESQLGWWNSQLNGKRIHSCSKPPASNSYHKYTHFPSGFQDIFPLTYHALVRFSSKRRGCWWPARTWQRSPSPSASPNPTPTRSPRWSYLGLTGGYSTMAKQR